MTRERRRAERLGDALRRARDGQAEVNLIIAFEQRATRSALDGLARWARDPGWCLCSEGIAVGHHRKAVCVAAEIERRAREARARGRKR